MALTLFLAQLIGLYCLIIGVLMLTRKQLFADVIGGYYRTPSTMFLPGLIAMFLGLMIILSHNVWNAGLLASVVTIVGWIAFVKGLWLLFAPQMAAQSVGVLKVRELMWLYGIIMIAAGGYLAYAGFTGLA